MGSPVTVLSSVLELLRDTEKEAFICINDSSISTAAVRRGFIRLKVRHFLTFIAFVRA